MKLSSRLFNCLGCDTQTVICSDCDRGQVYCGKKCAVSARIISHREANKRYQSSLKGRMNHAARQKRYRDSKQKVTDHGSSPVEENDVLPAVEMASTKPAISSVMTCSVCHFCQRPVTSWLRFGFLQHTSAASVTLWSKDKLFFRPFTTGDP